MSSNVRLIIMTQDPSRYNPGNLMKYLGACIDDTVKDGTIYKWGFDTAAGLIEDQDVGAWHLYALDIEMKPHAPLGLKGEVHLLILAPLDGLPLYDSIKLLEAYAFNGHPPENAVMHVPMQVADEPTESWHFSYSIPELAAGDISLLQWLQPDVEIPEVKLEEMTPELMQALLADFGKPSEPGNTIVDFGFGEIDEAGNHLDYVHSRDKDKPKH